MIAAMSKQLAQRGARAASNQRRLRLRAGIAMLAAMLGALAACTSVPQRTGEYLDERSGNTVAVVTQPLIFARQRTDVAAYARDYATLVAVEGDNAGKFSQYLLLYRWSTVDRRMSPPPPPDAGELQIQAEGRVIVLKPVEPFPFDLSHREQLHLPESADPVVHAYVMDLATLRFIAGSRVLSVVMPQETLGTPFVMWRDGRAALSRFVQRASGS
jgi:hypothetical protein